MKNRILIIAALALGLFYATGCTKTESAKRDKLHLKVNHTVDGKAVAWDTIIYRNEAGNEYSVERVQYYLSDLTFYSNKQFVARFDSVFYVDARIPGKTTFTLPEFPMRYIDSVTFLIGVSPKYNVPGGLPATMENTIMDWPMMMGGGYHFLKLEGRWKDGANTPGFAMHIGKPGFQVPASAAFSLLPRGNGADTLLMTMNINEWFRNPHVYSFSGDGVYSMGNQPLMLKLKENGTDVFNP